MSLILFHTHKHAHPHKHALTLTQKGQGYGYDQLSPWTSASTVYCGLTKAPEFPWSSFFYIVLIRKGSKVAIHHSLQMQRLPLVVLQTTKTWHDHWNDCKFSHSVRILLNNVDKMVLRKTSCRVIGMWVGNMSGLKLFLAVSNQPWQISSGAEGQSNNAPPKCHPLTSSDRAQWLVVAIEWAVPLAPAGASGYSSMSARGVAQPGSRQFP